VSALLKKEVKELFRTYRFWVLPAVFLFIALSAPVSAKFLPEILSSQLEQQNIKLILPEPSAAEAFQAYFKNLIQIGLPAVVLLSMGLVAQEKAGGVLTQVMAKPVGRWAVVLSKWVVHGIWFELSLAVAAAGCYLYTLFLFGRADAGSFVVANLLFAPYLLLIFSLTLSASAVFDNPITAGLLAFGGFFGVSLLPLFGGFWARYSPAALSDAAYKTIAGQAVAPNAVGPLIVAVGLVVVLLAGGILLFNRKEF
jgi:ABC-2 type transport system permease protein